jgi:class 3 adenylate cyclase
MARKLLSRTELYALLEPWKFEPPDAEANRALEDELWARAGSERAVLISDMSGFTRITRARGILHFLALFQQAQHIGERMFERHGGRFLKTAADNLFALFDTAGAAAACAQSMLHEAEKLNAGVPREDGHVKLCIGIGFGRILELSDDGFGDQVNVAFKLGEDVAEKGQILVSEPAVENLRKSATHKDLAAQLEGPVEVEVGHVRLKYWLLPPRK